MNTYYCDVTKVIGSQLSTGVQRVVRKIVSNSLKISEEFNIVIVPVLAVDGAFHTLSDAGLDALKHGKPQDGPGVVNHGRIQGYIKTILSLVPPIYAFMQERQLNSFIRRVLNGHYLPAMINPGNGDSVVLIDSFWGGSTVLDAASAARRNGAEVVTVLYDMIPVTHPELMPRTIAHAYPRAVARAARISSGIVTISQHCSRMVAAFLEPIGLDLPIRHFYLGYDVDAGPTSTVAITQPIHSEHETSYLMIGTIEPRKGHATALDAFDALWENGRNSRLFLVGKVGWIDPAFMDRCRNHPQYGKLLQLIHDASDADLAALMAKSDAVIMASTIEGFGLPLVEALAADLPVIASDIDVFVEIGGHSIGYFNCGDPVSLRTAIERFEGNIEHYRALARDFSWIDWEGAARQFLAAVAAVRQDVTAHD